MASYELYLKRENDILRDALLDWDRRSRKVRISRPLAPLLLLRKPCFVQGEDPCRTAAAQGTCSTRACETNYQHHESGAKEVLSIARFLRFYSSSKLEAPVGEA